MPVKASIITIAAGATPGTPVIYEVSHDQTRPSVLIGISVMPGANGFVGGNISSYEIRGSLTGAIDSEAKWSAATVLDGPWSPIRLGMEVGVTTAAIEVKLDEVNPHLPVLFAPWDFAMRCKNYSNIAGGISNSLAVDLS